MANKELTAKERRTLDGISLSPGEGKILEVGGRKVLVQRNKYLNKNGNPVHRVYEIDKSGNVGRSARGCGNVSLLLDSLNKRKKGYR